MVSLKNSSDFPELCVPGGLFEISPGMARATLREYNMGYPKRLCIVFYGGYNAARTTDAGRLRYIVGSVSEIMHRFMRKSFVTWMDYRLYRAVAVDGYKYAKIGSRIDFSEETLLKMATHVNPRKKLALIKRDRKVADVDPVLIMKRADFKDRVDKAVAKVMAMHTEDACG